MLLFFPSRYKGCPGQPGLPPRWHGRPVAKSSEMKKLQWLKKVNKKTPGEPQNEGSLPSLRAQERIPGEEHPPGKVTAQGRGDAAKQICVAGSLEETSSGVSGKTFPSRQKAEGKDGKEGREGGRKVASRQAPPGFPKEPAQHKGRKKLCRDREEKKRQKSFRGRAGNTKGGVNTGTAHGTGSRTPRQPPNLAAGWTGDHSSSVVGWKETPNHNIPR